METDARTRYMAFLDSSNYVCIEHYIEFHPRVWVLLFSANAPIVFVNFQAEEPTEVIVCSINAWMECTLPG